MSCIEGVKIPLFQAMDPDARKAVAMTSDWTSMSRPLSELWLKIYKSASNVSTDSLAGNLHALVYLLGVFFLVDG